MGEFVLNKRLKFADFRAVSILNFFESEKEVENFIFLTDINKRLSIPITPEEREKYLFTQFITDVIRLTGYDGVIFNSSVGDGFNVVVFDLDNIDYIEGNGKVFEVESLKYTYKECKVENFPNKVTHTTF